MGILHRKLERQRRRRRHFTKRLALFRRTGHEVAAARARRLRASAGRAIRKLAGLIARRKPDFNGHPANISRRLYPVVALANRCGLYVTATTDGAHTSTSYHYPYNSADGLGHAIDVAGTHASMVRFQREAAKRWGTSCLELFGPDAYYYKSGVRIAGAFPAHGDHVHVAL